MDRLPFKHEEEFTLTQSPNPEWVQGQKQVPSMGLATEENTTTFVAEEIDKALRYKLLVGGVAPRPIAFVSSQSPEGVQNLAPFSYFNIVGHDPATIVFSVARSLNGPKDTAKNILSTKEFVVNIMSEWFLESANYTAIDAPDMVSEFELSGLTPYPSDLVKPPRVAESAYAMECKLIHHYPLQNHEERITHDVMIGQVLAWKVRNEILGEKNRIDYTQYKPLGRLGGIMYSRVNQGFEIPRPTWEQEKDALKKGEDKV
ncbi:hypothetical protein K7432_001729 [Basidiobolus ranarum]|uniref:Flavin reductase like domain-containing protein n=1 Tax=Basidiobolus ranarum TaxID=34480 RepID=A0ABR2X2M2_9FUNG